MPNSTRGDRALESLYHHLRSVNGGHSKPEFKFVAKQCDDAVLPAKQYRSDG